MAELTTTNSELTTKLSEKSVTHKFEQCYINKSYQESSPWLFFPSMKL